MAVTIPIKRHLKKNHSFLKISAKQPILKEVITGSNGDRFEQPVPQYKKFLDGIVSAFTVLARAMRAFRIKLFCAETVSQPRGVWRETHCIFKGGLGTCGKM